MPLTVGEALALPVLAGARLVAGADRLDRPVRWAHASDLYDVADVLLGGELVLTTGVQLALADAQLRVYVRTLTARGVAAVVVECVRQFPDGLPAALIAEAETQGLPLAEVRRTVRFVEVTQAIHGRILGDQVARLRRAEEAGAAFTRVVLEERGLPGVLRALSQMLGRTPVVWLPARGPAVVQPPTWTVSAALEDALRALPPIRPGLRGGHRIALDVAGREERALRHPVWLGGHPAGTVVCLERRTPLDAADLVILDRAAAAVATELLLERGAEDALLAAHRELVTRILAGDSDPGLEARAAAVAELRDHDAMSVVVRRPADPWPRGPRLSAPTGPAASGAAPGAAARLRQRLADAGLRQAAVIEGEQLRAIVADETPARMLQRLARALDDGAAAPGIGVGGITDRVAGLREAHLQARFVAALRARDPALSPFFDRLGAHRLLYRLRHAEELDRFVRAGLGALAPPRPGSEPAAPADAEALLTTLEVLLACDGNKLEAARRLGVRRQSLYLRLQRIEARLGRPLADPGAQTDLRLALVGLAVRRAAAAAD